MRLTYQNAPSDPVLLVDELYYGNALGGIDSLSALQHDSLWAYASAPNALRRTSFSGAGNTFRTSAYSTSAFRGEVVHIPTPLGPILANATYADHLRGKRLYELKNHLGNVTSVVSDRKVPYFHSSTGDLVYFSPDIASAQDYYPFGSIMPGRSFSSGYRFGFNGKEQDSEVSGNGNQYDYGFRIYNPRVAKFLSVDPLSPEYPWYTPYQFAGNMPIRYIDLDGLEQAEPKSFATQIWNGFVGDWHANRAYEFAVKHGINEENIFHINVEDGPAFKRSIIIYHPVIDKETGKTVEYKHVFRQLKDGDYKLLTSDSNDDLFSEWDNYWDDDGNPVVTESDLSVSLVEAPPIIGGGGGSKLRGVVQLAGFANKTHSVYTFVAISGKKRYWGITSNFAKRTSAWAGKYIGEITEMLDNVPDRITARGIEQLLIQNGRKSGQIANEINSISFKRNRARYIEGINKAKDWLKKNSKPLYDDLKDEIDETLKLIEDTAKK